MLGRRHVINELGFVVRDEGAIIANGRPARRGLPWSVSEDAHLMRRLRDLEALGAPDPIGAVAREIGRGRGAAATRLRALRAGIEVAGHRKTIDRSKGSPG